MGTIVHNDGVQTVIHRHNDGVGTLTFEQKQDVTGIVESAKARHNEGMHGSSEMKLAASLPRILIEKYCNDNGITFQEWMSNKVHIKRMLNDPDLKAFRIWPGRI